MDLNIKSKQGRPSKIDKLPNAGNRKGTLDNFLEQTQKNKSGSNESNTEVENVTHRYKRAEISKVTAILT